MHTSGLVSVVMAEEPVKVAEKWTSSKHSFDRGFRGMNYELAEGTQK